MESIMLYYFSAVWCGPCKALSPIIEELSKELPEIEFVKIDTDTNQDMVAEYSVQSVPTMVVIKNGVEVARMKGAVPKNNLKAWLKSFT